MEQLNKVELIGIVGRINVQDFDGTKMARIALATNYCYKDREGAIVLETNWNNVIAWEGRRISCLDKIEKGTAARIVGRLRYDKYTGEDGLDHVVYEVVASHVEILDSRPDFQHSEEIPGHVSRTRYEQLAQLRRDAIDDIMSIMRARGLHEVCAMDIDEGSSPIVYEDVYDMNFTYTLDRIKREEDRTGEERLVFSASNSYDSMEWNDENIGIDELVGIADWLSEHEDALDELED